MNLKDFSNRFDIKFNSITSNMAPGLDEYEKSVFLTEAEKQLVKECFDIVLDPAKQGFDGSIKRQYDLSSLMKIAHLYDLKHHWGNDNPSVLDTLHPKGLPYLLPEDYFLPVNELIHDTSGNTYAVIPVTYAQYEELLTKPYQYPNKRQVWRLITNGRGVNSGSCQLSYKEDEEDTVYSKAKVSCTTAFASDSKHMRFTLEYDPPKTTPVGQSGVREDFTRMLTLLAGSNINIYVVNCIQSRLSDTNLPRVDAYMHVTRDFNSYGLEGMKCNVWHTDGELDNQKMKLYDNDYVLSYTVEYNTADNLDSSGSVQYAEVQVEGEASILGVLRTYLRASYDLCKQLALTRNLSSIAIDPVTYIIKVDFKHWEEGEIKHGTWMVWNGGFGSTKYQKLYYKFPEAIKVIKRGQMMMDVTDEDTQETTTLLVSTYTKVISNAKLDLIPDDGSVQWDILISDDGEALLPSPINLLWLLIHDKSQEEIPDYGCCVFEHSAYPNDGYIWGIRLKHADYKPLMDIPSGLQAHLELTQLDREKAESDPSRFKLFTWDVDDYTPNAYVEAQLERTDAVNPRHWDFAENFDFPQRVRLRDIKGFDVNNRQTLFTIELSPTKRPAVEVLGRFKGNIKDYSMRYVRQPKPIILINLPEGYNIDGYSSATDCELPVEMHEEILDRAVLLAKISFENNLLDNNQRRRE